MKRALAFLIVLAACEPSAVDRGPVTLSTPVEVAPGMRFVAVGAGWFHTCATAADGGVYCWGLSDDGTLGGADPETVCDDGLLYDAVLCTGTPQLVDGAPALDPLDGSPRHTCGLDEGGRAWCWGGGPGGQLGDGRSASRAGANPVAGDLVFVDLSVAVGGYGSCAIAVGGALYCWGPMDETAMGGGSHTVPTELAAGVVFDQVAVEQQSACGITGGEARCWGSNWYGQLGVGSVGQHGGLDGSVEPVVVTGGHTFTRVTMSLSHACGIRDDGAALCWGYLPGSGAIGGTPVPAGGPAFAELAAGGNHICALTAAGEAWCWGANDSGFLGDGTYQDRAVPTRVAAPAGVAFQQLALGGVHTCGLSTDGRLFCWGNNGFGQAGRTPGWLEP